MVIVVLAIVNCIIFKKYKHRLFIDSIRILKIECDIFLLDWFCFETKAFDKKFAENPKYLTVKLKTRPRIGVGAMFACEQNIQDVSGDFLEGISVTGPLAF